jgi:hypothetical protein
VADGRGSHREPHGGLPGRGAGAGGGWRWISGEWEPRPDVVPEVRRWAVGVLAGWGADDLEWQVTQLLTEVVTNVVLHAGTAFSVRLGHDPAAPGRVRCEVHDASPVLPRLRHHSTRATTGRGIRLLDAVSDRWGVDRETGGKTVWFEVDAGGSAGGSGDEVDDVELLMRAFEDAVPPPSPGRGVGTVSGDVHVVGRWHDAVAA